MSAAYTPGACPACNGILAAALVRNCTPEQVAHAAVHALSERDALLAALQACHDTLQVWFAVTDTREGREAVKAMNAARTALAKVRA